LQTYRRGVATSASAADEQLVGAEIVFGGTLIGHVEDLVRDPLTQRVRGLITTYGPTGRRVAVPLEWVAKRSAGRLVLGVGPRSLDDLSERTRLSGRTPATSAAASAW
jgi:PRC-barrel domain